MIDEPEWVEDGVPSSRPLNPFAGLRPPFEPGPAPFADQPLPTGLRAPGDIFVPPKEHPVLINPFQPFKTPPLTLRIEVPSAPLALKTVEARVFQDALQAQLALLGWHKWGGTGCAFDGPVEVELEFTYPPPASWSTKKLELEHWRSVSPEASDLAKLVLATLTGRAFKHPAQCAKLTVEKCLGAEPRTLVTVKALD